MNFPDFKKIFLVLLLVVFLSHFCVSKTNSKSAVLEDILDFKDFKKLLRTKTNVLIMFISSAKETQPEVKTFHEAGAAVKGVGTLVIVDCGTQERKKLCKKLKIAPAPYVLKHYKDGDYHKNYDRQISVTSISNFMRDPAGDLPWEEDPAGADVVHFSDYASFTKMLKRDSRPMLVMFYVPWCGYCKRLKPDYSKAALELKSQGYILAAMDVERTENAAARRAYNITGFPTILYFENGRAKQTYEGDNNKDAIISFMQDPTAATAQKVKEPDWSDDTNSEIVHLTTEGFDPAIKDEKSVLVMFYAPWCGHCKRMKPEYEKAALAMKERNVPGVLAALDATKESAIGERYKVKGYPTVKYFVNGEFKFDVNIREAEKIVDFMRDPKEPPPPPPPEKPWEEEEGTDVLFLNEENFSTILKRKKHALVLFYAPWCGHCKNVKPEFNSAATAMKDDPRVVFAALDCTRHASVCQTYEVRGYPTIKYFSYLKTKIDYSGGRTKQEFVKFMSNPTEAAAGDNEKIAEPFGNFPGSENILMIGDKDYESKLKQYERILVFFYAPWCGHCKEMKPEYSKAAAKVAAASKKYRLAAVDCTVNNKLSEKFNIKAFPTILLFEHGEQTKSYKGKRTAQDLFDFLLDAKESESHDEL